MLRAIVIGLIAAVAVPYALCRAEGPIGALARTGTIQPIAHAVVVSVPIFVVVASAAWALLGWSNR